MVYVLNRDGQPLMPTENHAKIRLLLKNKKAKVVKRSPFTVQLLYEVGNHIQPISLGVDAGSKHIGLSATTKDKVLFEADVELRNDIVDLPLCSAEGRVDFMTYGRLAEKKSIRVRCRIRRLSL